MGWFSATITGGDSPLDWIGDLEQKAGADRYGEPPVPLTAEMIDKNLNKMVRAIKEHSKKRGSCDTNIAWQILGVHIIYKGAKMPDNIRKEIIKNIRDKDSEWKDPDERQFFLDHFKNQVKNYKDGEILELADECTYAEWLEEKARNKYLARQQFSENLRKNLNLLLEKYTTTEKIGKEEAIRDLLIDLASICHKNNINLDETLREAFKIYDEEYKLTKG